MNQLTNLFLIGGADLEILDINQLLTAYGNAERVNLAGHLLARVPKLIDFQNLINNAQAIADIEFLQIIRSASGANTNINSNNLNLTMYPPCIPGCGLNKTNLINN